MSLEIVGGKRYIVPVDVLHQYHQFGLCFVEAMTTGPTQLPGSWLLQSAAIDREVIIDMPFTPGGLDPLPDSVNGLAAGWPQFVETGVLDD
ncbi:hypothetical protein VTI74DRAFT_8866 [Chaetomium olivicolor]